MIAVGPGRGEGDYLFSDRSEYLFPRLPPFNATTTGLFPSPVPVTLSFPGQITAPKAPRSYTPPCPFPSLSDPFVNTPGIKSTPNYPNLTGPSVFICFLLGH